jgi:hypothetical protein
MRQWVKAGNAESGSLSRDSGERKGCRFGGHANGCGLTVRFAKAGKPAARFVFYGSDINPSTTPRQQPVNLLLRRLFAVQPVGIKAAGETAHLHRIYEQKRVSADLDPILIASPLVDRLLYYRRPSTIIGPISPFVISPIESVFFMALSHVGIKVNEVRPTGVAIDAAVSINAGGFWRRAFQPSEHRCPASVGPPLPEIPEMFNDKSPS